MENSVPHKGQGLLSAPEGIGGLGPCDRQLLPGLRGSHFQEKPFSALDSSEALCPETVSALFEVSFPLSQLEPTLLKGWGTGKCS